MDARQPLDIYDKHAVKLMQMGYHPLPIAPLWFPKEKQKRPVRYDPHTGQLFGLNDWPTLPPITDPQPGANIGALMGKSIVALDYDHDDAAVIISDRFPPSPVNKAGERGFTAFYRIDFDVPSEDFFNDDGELVLQILSTGRQTVVPPSIHPGTLQPYRWTNGHSLYDTPIEELPLLPHDYRERILALGFKSERPGKERPKPDKSLNKSDQGAPDGPFADLNQMAIRDLAKWVPELNIHKLRRRVGRFANYEGVAQWREGTTGKKLEDRSPNLKISGMGIRDFGDGRGYSPLDLVMAARGCELWEAYKWLDERVRPPSNIKDEDIDRLLEEAPSIEPLEEPADDADMTEAEEAMLGPAWEFGDPIPQEEPMLVPVFIPARPLLGFLGGQRSTFKTFVTNDLTVAVASGGEFAGQKVTYPGLVVQIELEGSLSRVRVTAAARHRGITEKLPIWQFTRTPPPILINKRLNPEWKKWTDVFVRVAKRKADRLGLPLALITMDPAMYFAGVDDNNSWCNGPMCARR
jgi:bifunctional DNA primase/polymerase-like protein/AAA domain-containing protein